MKSLGERGVSTPWQAGLSWNKEAYVVSRGWQADQEGASIGGVVQTFAHRDGTFTVMLFAAEVSAPENGARRITSRGWFGEAPTETSA